MAIKENLTKNNVRAGDRFSSCCGSRFVVSGKPKKWKNQYGEGITPGKEVDFTKDHHGILMAEGLVGKAGGYAKGTINHIKTKNGNITIGIREIY